MYGAKGGEVYVLGNAAGRPLINAVGKPRVVINGTALDYLAESFMAGNPYNGGGFVILNGLTFDKDGQGDPPGDTLSGIEPLFPRIGRSAYSFVIPIISIVPEQLNGGQIFPFTAKGLEADTSLSEGE